MPRIIWGTLAAAAIAVGATGCGTTINAGPTTAQGPASTGTSEAEGSGASETSTGGGSSTGSGGTASEGTGSGGTESGTKHCTSNMLGASLFNHGAGAGQRYATLALHNTSSVPCTTGGWPGLRLSDGADLPTKVVRQGDAETITIQPNSEAYAQLHWGAVPAGDEGGPDGCGPEPTQLKVIPPNERKQIVADWDDAGPVCRHGEITVKPLTLTEPR